MPAVIAPSPLVFALRNVEFYGSTATRAGVMRWRELDPGEAVDARRAGLSTHGRRPVRNPAHPPRAPRQVRAAMIAPSSRKPLDHASDRLLPLLPLRRFDGAAARVRRRAPRLRRGRVDRTEPRGAGDPAG